MLEAPMVHDSHVTLGPGDMVVLFTDGVTEARHDGVFFGEDRLQGVIDRSAALGAQAVADAVVKTAVEFGAGPSRDDMAVMAIHVPPAARA